MRKKIIAVTLIFVGIGLICASFLAFIGFFDPSPAGLLIDAEPKSAIYINGEKAGETPYDSTLEASEVVVKLIPTDNPQYDDYETKVSLEPGVKTIIKRNFSEREEEASGVIISFEKVKEDAGQVSVVTIPDNGMITFDNRVYGFAPLRSRLDDGEHELRVSQNGFMDKKLKIVVHKGYKLTAVVKLAKIAGDDGLDTSDVLSSTTSNMGKIEILPTDIGFLRVRKENNIASEIIGQVKPGEVYDVIEISSNGGWYKIKINITTFEGETREIEGWVSGEFAKKLE